MQRLESTSEHPAHERCPEGHFDKFSTIDRPLGRSERNCIPERVAEDDEMPSDPTFTLFEFSRLVDLMRDDERVRSCLFRLGQELRRAELDSCARRISFGE